MKHLIRLVTGFLFFTLAGSIFFVAYMLAKGLGLPPAPTALGGIAGVMLSYVAGSIIEDFK